MENKSLLDELNFVGNYIPKIAEPLSKDALFSIWISQDIIDEEKLQLLKIFVYSHLKMNNRITVFLLTNHADKIKEHINEERFRVLSIPFVGMHFINLKIYAIYHLMQNFSNFQKLFIFDTDLLPVHNYDNIKIFKNDYDIGFTFHNEWKRLNKFPFNAGFMIVNFKNKKKIDKFMDVFIKTYEHIVNNQSEVVSANYVNHDKRDWYGDQYLPLLLLKDKINENVKIYSDWQIDDFNYRVFNELIFNFSSYVLKSTNSDFDINKYFKREVFPEKVFIHLKGHIKDKFIFKVAELLKIPV